MKSTKVELYQLYVNVFCKYDDPTFNEFSTVHEYCSDLMSFTWASHEPPADLYVPSYLTFNIASQ